MECAVRKVLLRLKESKYRFLFFTENVLEGGLVWRNDCHEFVTTRILFYNIYNLTYLETIVSDKGKNKNLK